MPFDNARASHAINFIESLTIPEGKLAGEPFRLLDWQRKIASDVYGTVRADGRRQYRKVVIVLPKKSGKSPFMSAISLYHTFGDGEMSGQVFGCAVDREQAGIVYDYARDMFNLSEELQAIGKNIDSTKRIVNYETNTFYKVMSAETASKHGVRPSCIIFDELHALKDRKLWDIMTYQTMVSREEPILWIITTAGDNINSVCYEEYQYAKKVLKGEIKDDSLYVVIYEAEETDDWTDEEVWKKCNPSLGITIDLEMVRDDCKKAKQNPLLENLFRQFRLNQWVTQAIRWMPMREWSKCVVPELPDLSGRPCCLGEDLSSRGDLTANAIVWPEFSEVIIADKPTYELSKVYIRVKFYMPEMKAEELKDRYSFLKWAKQGYITLTPGNVIDYNYVKRDIFEAGKVYEVQEIGFDPWNSTQFATELQDAGFTCVEVIQGMKTLSPATKKLMELVLSGRAVIEYNPCLDYCADNMVVRKDPAGNIKPDKEKATEKIDGVVAVIIALCRAVVRKEPVKSVYEERGLRSI